MVSVVKRNGKKEALDIEKLHRVVMWACENISGVSASEIEIKSQIQFHDGMTTQTIQETLIKAAADLITEETPNYQYVAGRLVNYALRKEVYGEHNPRTLIDQIRYGVQTKIYTPELLEWYTEEEIQKLDRHINHDKDWNLTYVAMEQFRGKYLVKNRVSGKIFETPQFCYMLIAMTLFKSYAKQTRLNFVMDYYDAISNHDISLPTPIMSGVRTNLKQFSSCVLIECGDSLDSINATTDAIVKYVSQRAGIGIGSGSIRAVKSEIRGGEALHTGVIPFVKYFQSAVKSCSQGGVRGGAATIHFPLWHLEIEDILVLKNNKGTEDNRARHLDYSIQFNKLMYERLLSGGDITLFSPSDVPGLYDSFFLEDQTTFTKLYTEAEANPAIRKKKVPALQLFSAFLQERKDTGRIYAMNVDHCNSHSSFDVPVRMSNLCQEITLPTKKLTSPGDEGHGEIALCTLSAINWGNIKNKEDFEKPCELAVRALDELLDYQNYPLYNAEYWAVGRRSLGVGIINFAYWLAKNGVKYSDQQALELVDEYAEAWSYYLIKASINLAKEKTPCEYYQETKYSRNILPIDTYKKAVDDLVPHNPKMDWDSLRHELLEHGIRNSTLMAIMPAETSAQIANATNGIEPPRALVSVKLSKEGSLRQVVPQYAKLKNKYDLLWEQESPEGYLKICAVLQKYVDQSISTNTSYNPKFYPEQKVPLSDMLKHFVMCYKYGIKTLYYCNTNDQAGEVSVTELAKGETDDQNCESCKI